MKVLIVGAAGFVGSHLIGYLSLKNNLDVYATKLYNEEISNSKLAPSNIINLDILNKEQVEKTLEMVKPDYIIHLAAQSSVSLSWKEPALTYNVNIVGTVNLLESIKKQQLNSRVLIVGSAEEYGVIEETDLPINESLEIKPINPYAVSKVAQELAAKVYVNAHNMDIVMVRAFNHIGSGQSPVFAISDFAKQIAEIEKGLREPVIFVGNLDVKRDFSDVRDIIRGYWMLLQSGIKGQIYNIGSGKSYLISELLNKLVEMSETTIQVKVDHNKFRPADIKELRADISKIRQHVSWEPQVDITTSLQDILSYWRTKC
jgi:GDP-4-dehydro-6-deoxy-D-mannose reductase